MYHELPSGASLRSAIRFNGASVFQRRKDMHWTPNIHSRLRFNGASVFQRRKEADWGAVSGWELGLQWGLRLSTEEGALKGVLPALRNLASMGPPSFNGGRGCVRRRDRCHAPASMGPPSFNGGRSRRHCCGARNCLAGIVRV